MMSTGLPCDQVGGRAASSAERAHPTGCPAGAEVTQPVRGEHAGTAPVGENGEPVARKPGMSREDFGRAEKIVQLAHPQDAARRNAAS
jgi:hypothetical protein